MVIIGLILMVVVLALGLLALSRRKAPAEAEVAGSGPEFRSGVALPSPVYTGDTPVEQALLARRSVRAYQDEPLALAEIGQLLWAAQGIINPRGYRTAPSAGALYPLEITLLVGDIRELPAGVYRYLPGRHQLVRVAQGDFRAELANAALGQEAVGEAPAVITIAGVYQRTTKKYSQRGVQYVHMEVGAVAQNVYLQAEALGLGTVFIGAFVDDEVKEVLRLGAQEQPLGLMPVGRPAEG